MSDVQKTCLVTGAAGGLGTAIANAFLSSGYRVCLSDVDLDAAEKAVDALSAADGQAIPYALDVTKNADFDKACEHLVDKWGGISVLVNNAAMTRVTDPFEISGEEFDQIVQINMRSVFFGCQVFGAHFRDAGYGRIVNVASLAGQNGGAATGAHYAASKGGVLTLTKVFARELAAHGVTVNAISPGPLDVPLVREILSPEKVEGLLKALPVGQLGDPDFIGQLAVLLASPTASSMTGSTLDANGGLYVR